MKKIISLGLILIFIVTLFSGCVWVQEYPASKTSFSNEVDNSIPLSMKNDITFQNKSRGFRAETYINLGANEAYPNSKENYMDVLNEAIEKYKDDDIKLIQVYVYLCNFVDCDIPQSALNELKSYLEYIKSKDMKILLRFAYETGDSKKGVTTKRIEKNCKILKSFINENIDLINQTVYAFQLGMIGLWGEGHSSIHHINVKKVIKAVADMVPQDIPIMVRTPEMLKKVPKDLEHRFSLHDDFLVGYDHEWGMISFDDENYIPLLNKCKYTITDGEMPWGNNEDPVDMIGVVKQCVGYGLTSLSIEHNYKEDGQIYDLEKWKNEYLTKEELEKNHFPYNPMLLEDNKISVYDYLKFHLGYQLVASNLKIENSKASFMLTNYGFALPYNYEMHIYLNDREVKADHEFDFNKLTQFGQDTFTFDYNNEKISVELVNKRDKNDKIKLYNNIPFENGLNVIYQ